MDYNKKKCIEHFEFFNILKILTQTSFHLTRRILGNALKPRKRHFQNEKNGNFFTFPLRFYWIDLNVFSWRQYVWSGSRCDIVLRLTMKGYPAS